MQMLRPLFDLADTLFVQPNCISQGKDLVRQWCTDNFLVLHSLACQWIIHNAIGLQARRRLAEYFVLVVPFH